MYNGVLYSLVRGKNKEQRAILLLIVTFVLEATSNIRSSAANRKSLSKRVSGVVTEKYFARKRRLGYAFTRDQHQKHVKKPKAHDKQKQILASRLKDTTNAAAGRGVSNQITTTISEGRHSPS